MSSISLRDVYRARKRTGGLVRSTPLEPAPALGSSVWLKLENLQHTRSFKIRGAANALAALEPTRRARGVIAASAGNHAQGLAAAGEVLGVRVLTVMPENTPALKVQRTKERGARVLLFGSTYDAAETHARHLEKKQGFTFVSAYNDAVVVAGQATVALEILSDLPTVAQVVVPVGGGGLVAGVGLAAKAVNPGIDIVGVQSVATPAMYNYVKATTHPQAATLADGLAGDVESGSITFDLVAQVMDDIVLVTEEEIENAIRWLLREHGQVAEGAGAVGVAAALSGRISLDRGPTAIVISGGNIDYEVLQRVVAGG